MDNSNLNFFSMLTNSLLVLIVSHLPFKEAVRTSILSKQWCHIWRESSNLEFHEKFFVNLEETDEQQRIQRSSFFDFVKNFLANYPQVAIHKFSLSCPKPEDFLTDVQNFIIFAISKNVKELELNFSDPRWREEDENEKPPPVVELPFQVYQNVNLESLKLFSCNFDVSRFTNFTILKRVSLGWIEISLDSIKSLLLTCPLVEILSLKKCWEIEHFEICLENLRLKNLSLDDCNFIQDFIWIEGPKLQFFKYSGKVSHFHLYNQREMIEADLDFGMEPKFDENGSLLYHLLQELYAVNVLTVCSVLLQMIPSGEEPLSLQAPLVVRHLILKTAMHSYEFCGINFMLRSCPNLEILTFDIGPAKIFPDYEPPFEINSRRFWSNDLWVVHRCIYRSLRVVTVKGFKGTANEVYILRYIIKRSQRLRKLNLFLADEDENGQSREIYMSRARVIMRLSSASPNLQIFVF